MLDFLIPFTSELSECSYLPDQMARLPMSLPCRAVTGDEFDELMELGYRRSGSYYYRTQCPACRACQPIRLPVSKFRPNRSQRRALQRAGPLRFELAHPSVDASRVELFNRHREQRGLNRTESPLDASGYRSFLMSAPNASFELSLWHESHLVAISIADVGVACFSAVYCFFDPDYSEYSPGTLCILKQIALAADHLRDMLYLGYYVADNPHLNYKANFRPHQRKIDGTWTEFP